MTFLDDLFSGLSKINTTGRTVTTNMNTTYAYNSNDEYKYDEDAYDE